MTPVEWILDRAQLVAVPPVPFSLLAYPLGLLIHLLGTMSSRAASTKASPGFKVRSNQVSTRTLGLFLLFCFCLTATAQRPTCDNNVCSMPTGYCVEECPRNRIDGFFRFGSRLNNRCAASRPGKALEVNGSDISISLPLMGPPQLVHGSSNDTKELAERQDLWPEYGLPDCTWALCQFSGPACILWCTETQVFMVAPVPVAADLFGGLLRGKDSLGTLQC